MSDFYLTPGKNNEAIIRNIGKTIRRLDATADKRLHVQIKPYKRRRTLEQNAYYWSTVLPTIKAWYRDTHGKPSTEEIIHEELKPLYVPYASGVGTTGLTVRVYRSTTQLTTAEFNRMIDEIREDFAEMGCHIPPPDPDWKKGVRQPKERAA